MKKRTKKEQFTERAAGYILGALDEKERQDFERELRTEKAERLMEVEEFRRAASFLPTALKQREPSPRVRERIMAVIEEEVRGDMPDTRTERMPWVSKPRTYSGLRIGVVFAAIVLMIGLGIYVNSLLQTIDRQHIQITELRNELGRQQEILSLLQSPEVNIVFMNGLEPSPQGHGKILWDPQLKKAVLYISDLPPTPTNKDYQLWEIVDNKPVSAGVFSVSSEGGGYFKVEPIEVPDVKRVNAFAVTLEPKGGVPKPTGEMYLLGSPRF